MPLPTALQSNHAMGDSSSLQMRDQTYPLSATPVVEPDDADVGQSAVEQDPGCREASMARHPSGRNRG